MLHMIDNPHFYRQCERISLHGRDSSKEVISKDHKFDRDVLPEISILGLKGCTQGLSSPHKGCSICSTFGKMNELMQLLIYHIEKP